MQISLLEVKLIFILKYFININQGQYTFHHLKHFKVQWVKDMYFKIL